MKIHRALSIGLSAGLLLLTAPLHAAIVYSNTTADTGDTLVYAANGFTQIGDQIQLAGTARVATSATVQFFSDGLAGTFDATLRLFNVGSPVGAQIGPNFIQTGIAAPANDVLNVTFTLPNILVPDSLIFTVSVANLSAGVDIAGVDMFEPPFPGSSDNTFAIANNGSGFVQTGTQNENVFFELQANTPEPSTFVLGAAAVLLAWKRRSKLTPAREPGARR